MTTFGEISWNDNAFGDSDKKQVNSKDLFLRLDDGSNELRLVTQPFQYLVHKYKKEGDPGFGQKISCSMVHGKCVLCELGDKPKPRWFLGVLSRKHGGAYRILDISYSVFSQIRKLAKNTQRWGDPTKYDIDIVVDKNGGASGYYSVQPISKEALSATDQKTKDEADLDDLKRRATPLTPDLVQKRIDKINGATPANVTGVVTMPVQKQAAPAATMPSHPNMNDDLDEEFPAHDA